MRAGLIVTSVLALGTAVVFGAAALTATLFPNGTVVAGNGNMMMFERGFVGGGVGVPAPAPAIDVPGAEIEWANPAAMPGEVR